MRTDPAQGWPGSRATRDGRDRLEAHARKLARLRRSRAASNAIVASDRRIPALRLLLSATLALALVLHWLR